MLMLISNVEFQDSLCPRRSCTGKGISKNGNAGLVTCPECGLRFIPQVSPADSADVNDIVRMQRMEDARLFGKRASSEEAGDADLSRQMLDVIEDIEMMDVSDDERADPPESQSTRMRPHRNVLTSQLSDMQKLVELPSTSFQSEEPPIMSWMSQTMPPKNPALVREWREAAETEQLELKEREAKDLEVFRNVQIMMPVEAVVPGNNEPLVADLEQNDLDLGARVYYRNIVDRYPQIQDLLARRLAIGNWQRQKRLTAKQNEAERARYRAASRALALERRRKRKLSHLNGQTQNALAEAEDWEDVDDEGVCETPGMDPHRWPVPGVDIEYSAFGHATEVLPSWFSFGPPLAGTGQLMYGGIAEQSMPYFPTTQHWPLQSLPAADTSLFDALPPLNSQQGPTYQNHNFLPNITRMKEKRFCSLPPLPLPLGESEITASSMLCYLCHSHVHIRRKHCWR